jgi:peptidase M28-like protein
MAYKPETAGAPGPGSPASPPLACWGGVPAPRCSALTWARLVAYPSFFCLSGVVLAALVSISILFASGCRQSSTPAASAASQTSFSQLRPEDFDPKRDTPPALPISGEKAYQNLKDFVALGPRFLGSPGHAKAEQFILSHLGEAQIEQDKFTAQTPAGPFAMNNILAKFPGKKDGIIVIAGHYDTNYPLRNTSFIGANDGGSDVGLMLEIAGQLRAHPPEGYSIWLLFTDGEEAVASWTDSDSVYGSKHLAQRWKADGTAAKIKAFLLLDMVADKDLNIERDTNSAPWLLDVIARAAERRGQQRYFFARANTVGDDHVPFAQAGIPVADIIDLEYGFQNIYHHTTEDTPDKCSAQSLQIVGDVTMETVRALNTR